jgi:hypothetical protein
MAGRDSASDRAKRWDERITAANKVYDKWVGRFKVARLREYYEGQQIRDDQGAIAEDDDRYVINLIFPTIETQQPSLMFYRPTVKIEPAAGARRRSNSQSAAARAKLCEDDGADVHRRSRRAFQARITTLALRDAPFAFGRRGGRLHRRLDRQPNAGKPVLNERTRRWWATTASPSFSPKISRGQRAAVLKRIPPHTVRVSRSLARTSSPKTTGCGYYEWHYVEDLKRNPSTRTRPTSRRWPVERHGRAIQPIPTRTKHAGMVKLWRIWDLRAEGQARDRGRAGQVPRRRRVVVVSAAVAAEVSRAAE